MSRRASSRRAVLATVLSVAGLLAVGASPSLAATPEVWSQLGGGPRHSSVNPYESVLSPSNVSGLHQAWAASAGAAVLAPPAVYNGVVYTGSSGKGVTAIKASSGAIVWHKLTSEFSSLPAVGSGKVFVSSGPRGTGASIKALDPASGSTLWSRAFSARPLVPVVTNGIVYVAAGKNVVALKASTGAVIWSTPTLTAAPLYPPAVFDGRLYVCVADRVVAYDALTGQGIWSWGDPGGRPMQSYPVVADGNVYVSPGLTHLVALDPTRGAVHWYVEGSDSSVAAGGGRVYVRLNGTISSRSAETGASVWTVDAPEVVGAPAVANGVLYYSTSGGGISARSASSGAVLWTSTIGTTTASTAAVANGKVYVGSDAGKVFAFGL